MNRNDYVKKMEELFSDNTTYKLVKRNPLRSLQKKVKIILQSLNNQKYLIHNYHNNQLTQSHTMLAKAYWLPTLHKPNHPYRPIISLINSPTHFLATIIYNDLKKAISLPKSHINNSLKFRKKIENISIPDNYILLSLDVSSLFTNVPKELVIKALDKRFSKINTNCFLPFVEIIKCTKFLFDNTFFKF